MKTDIEVLDGALALVEGDGRWTQGAYCRDRANKLTESPSTAASFCLEGALAYASGYFQTRERDTVCVSSERKLHSQWNRLKFLVLLQADTTAHALCGWNDLPGTSQEDAVLALKKARASLEDTDADD